MLPFSLFLALKYLKPKRTFLSVISIISVTGVMLGVAVLIIVLSVMTGFDDMLRAKILGFDAHVTISSAQGIIEEPDELAQQVRTVEGVIGVAPGVEGLVFVQHDGVVQTPYMRGVDPRQEQAISQIPSHIVSGDFSLDEDEVIIGQELARRLNVRVGEKILVYSPQTFMAGRDEVSLPEELRVSGIFEIGMWEYDIGFILMPMELACDMYGVESGVHTLRVMTRDPYQVSGLAHQLYRVLSKTNPDLVVRTWQDQHRQLFDALQVEKNMMFFLLIFIVLVAAFGITNSLIIVVVQKTKEIGLLKALGFQSASIMRVFFWQGWIQGVFGCVLGFGMGLLVLHYRNTIMRWMAAALHMDLFPRELYHLSEIPARTTWSDVVLVAVLSMLICTLAGLLPAWRASRLEPAPALRYE